MNDTILECYTGSYAYGTNSSDSDIDIIKVSCSPIEFYLGLDDKKSTHSIKEEEDIQSYDIKHFLSLCLKSNPNIIQCLWMDDYIYIDKKGALLVSNRELFSTKLLIKKINSYAYNMNPMKGKEAYHCVRLLNMGIDFLKTGKIIVKRPEASYLKQLKNNIYSIKDIVKEKEILFKEINELLEQSDLPDLPNFWAVNELCKKIIKSSC